MVGRGGGGVERVLFRATPSEYVNRIAARWGQFRHWRWRLRPGYQSLMSALGRTAVVAGQLTAQPYRLNPIKAITILQMQIRLHTFLRIPVLVNKCRLKEIRVSRFLEEGQVLGIGGCFLGGEDGLEVASSVPGVQELDQTTHIGRRDVVEDALDYPAESLNYRGVAGDSSVVVSADGYWLLLLIPYSSRLLW